MNKRFDYKQTLQIFYATPPKNLSIHVFYDILQAIVETNKHNPEVLKDELLKFMCKYVTFKGDSDLLDILDLIRGH